MLEIILCSLVTVLPDYLYRRYRQGKRIGHEITLFSVWYELRFGLITCLMLTVALITMIFYYHPSTTSATLYYRTVPIIPETIGRVAEVHIDFSAPVKKGDVIFRLDNSKQQAALRTAGSKIAEVDAAMLSAQADIMKAEGQLQEAKGSVQQASDELDVKRELQKRNPGIVPQRDIEKLEVALAGRQGSLDAATASKQSAMIRVSALLPAEKASAEAALAEAQVDLDKTYIRAGVDGRVEQFFLRPGDVVNPMIRSAGILIPDGRGTPRPFGRVWTDRRAGHEGRNGGRGHLHLQAVDDHSDGDHERAGLHRGGPVQGRRATARSPADGTSGHHSGLHGADLQRRPRRRNARQQLHRQCLHQQPRTDLLRKNWRIEELLRCMSSMRPVLCTRSCCGFRPCCCRSRRWC